MSTEIIEEILALVARAEEAIPDRFVPDLPAK